jgi:cytochrome c oxidase subunit 2
VLAIAQLTRLYELSRKLSKKREEDISYANNKLHAKLMLVFMFVFFAFYIGLTVMYGDKLLPVSASEHGESIDTLMDLNIVIVSLVFFLVNGLLFFFASKYYKVEGGKAMFQSHNNKLEMIWTIIPTVVLFVIIISGLIVWNDTTGVKSPDNLNIELYSKQYHWTARYAGDDNVLGQANVNFISSKNPVGVVSSEVVSDKLTEIKVSIAALKEDLKNKVYSDEIEDQKRMNLHNLKAQFARVSGYAYESEALNTGYDDKLVKAEFHIPVDQMVNFQFRSQDVIHSAYFPHLRAQMNTVPGNITRFKLTPDMTTQEMRDEKNDENFNYVLLCNKICGGAHYKMNMIVVVLEKKEYNEWMNGKYEKRNGKKVLVKRGKIHESTFNHTYYGEEPIQTLADKEAAEAEAKKAEEEVVEGGEEDLEGPVEPVDPAE